MLVAALVLCLYGWAYIADVASISSGLLVGDLAAITAALALITGFVSYLWAPKKDNLWQSLVVFIMLAAVAATVIATSGGYTSPYIGLWIIVAAFAGVFGWYGLLPLFVAVTGYLLIGFFQGSLSREAIITIALTGELPLVISYLIWHRQGAGGGEDRAYRELASELSEVAGKSEIVINAIADGVIALNGQGTIELINPAAQQITGWSKRDAMALNYKSVLRLIDKNDVAVESASDPVAQVLGTNQEVASNDFSLMTHSDKKVLVSIIVSPIGKPGAGAIVVFRDITKEKIEERQQAEFISTASHEMRTPVASIEGYLGLALNPATAQVDDKARDFITKAHESAQHLGRLFQDLLDITKAEDGRLSTNPKVIDVIEFTNNIVQGLRPQAEEKNLRLVFKPLPDDKVDKTGERRLSPAFFINVDNDHFREVVSNLVENAIKYTLSGDVSIDVGGDSDHVLVTVADSGIGIPEEDQAHLFQKFYRVDNSETREIGGTGLGLYLCRRLVESMNGRIWVESVYKQGSNFFVELPRISHEEATHLIESASAEAEAEQEEREAQASAPAPTPEPAPPVVETPPQAPVVPVIKPPTTPGTPAAESPPPEPPVAPQPPPSRPPEQTVHHQALPPQPTQHPPTQPSVSLEDIENNPEAYLQKQRENLRVPFRK